MNDQAKIYYSSGKRITGAALGEALLISVIVVSGVFDKFTYRNLLLSLLICLIVFVIMYAIEWSKRTVKSVEFTNDKIVIVNSATDNFSMTKPKIEIDLKSITKIYKKRLSTSWHIECEGNNSFKLNLYAFDPNDEDQIISKIKIYTDQQSRREGR